MNKILSPLRVALALVAIVLPGVALAGDLIRLADREDLFGWEAVGRLEVGENSYCTGVLIAPDLVLTAAHCVHSQTGKRLHPQDLSFRAGFRHGTSIAVRNIKRFVVVDGYAPSDGMSAENVRRDAALLELEGSIPTSVASPFALHDAPSAGDAVSVVSYGRNRDETLSWQRECDILARGGGLMSFNCNVTFGSSGAPVFSREGRRARIVSLVVGGHKTEDGSSVAYGMDLVPVVRELKNSLRAMPSAATAGASFRRVQIGQGGQASGAKFEKAK